MEHGSSLLLGIDGLIVDSVLRLSAEGTIEIPSQAA